MTKFPELPPLPDIASPIKNVVDGLKRAIEGLKEADVAGQQFTKSLKEGKETFDEIMKRRKQP